MYIVINNIYSTITNQHNVALKTFGDSLEDSLTVDQLFVTCDKVFDKVLGVEALSYLVPDSGPVERHIGLYRE